MKLKSKVKVKNLDRGSWLAEDVTVARSIWARTKGLLGKKTLENRSGFFIAPCQSIHSFFMAFPFDAVFVDKTLRVVHLIPSMPSNRISPWVFRAWGVLELPAGTIAATGTQVGDQLDLED